MLTRTFAAAALFFSLSSASAAGLYLGASAGFSSLDCDRCAQDPGLGLKFVGGFHLLPYTVALEGGYARLRSSGDAPAGDAKQDTLFVAGVLSYPLTDKFLVSAKLGPSYSRVSAGGSKGNWNRDVYWGAGLSVWASKNGTVRLEYDQFSRERNSASRRDSGLISLGYVYRF